MEQPELLKSDARLTWSTGRGIDVWAMFCSCLEGDLERVRKLLAADPSLIECSYAYRTPLYFAVRENRLEVARYLLDHGANPAGFAVNDSFVTLASDRGNLEMVALLEERIRGVHWRNPMGEEVARRIRDHDLEGVRKLLDDHPESVHARDERSNQPIHWATMTRQPDMVDLLLERGADIEAKRLDGARPIHLFHGDYHFRGWSRVSSDWPVRPYDILEHLRKRGAYCDLCTACHVGDIQRVRELLAEDPGLANRLSEHVTYYLGSGAPINNAAEAGHLEIVKLLLQHGADPNLPEPGIAPQGRALYSAIVEKHYDIARLLLDAGSIPNQSVESSADALSRAISNEDEQAIELLCSHGAAREVHLLAYDGDIQTAAAVFAANPKLADDPEALANAAGEGKDAFVRLMLRYCPDLPSRLQFPGWLVAAKNESTNRLLFQHGMDPNQRDWLGVAPLHQMARSGRLEAAKLFVEHGARLDVRDEDIQSTPLAWAAKFGQLEMVDYFLSIGAPKSQPDDPEWAKPIQWARRRGHRAIEERLS